MEIKITVLAKYIAALKLFAAVKDVRTYLASIGLDIGRSESRLFATDGARLAVVRVLSPQSEITAPLRSVAVPIHLFASVTPSRGPVEITLGECDPDWFGARPVSVSQGGVMARDRTHTDKTVDWLKVVPLTVSGKPAHLDPKLLADFAKAAKLLGQKLPATVAQNGTDPSLVLFEDPYSWSTVRNASLARLVATGFALEITKASGARYCVASGQLLVQKAIYDARRILTFQAMADKLGRDIGPRAVKARCRRKPLAPLDSRKYPDRESVQRRALVESQSPFFTQQDPIEPGDRFEFSSPGLTAWYVQQFVTANQLKP